MRDIQKRAARLVLRFSTSESVFSLYRLTNIKVTHFFSTQIKSCSAALRVLGYNVADYIETCEFLGSTWKSYLDGNLTIEDVLAKYSEHGFDKGSK